MARKKTAPRNQLSLFDLQQEQKAELKQENEQENTALREALYDNRTNSALGYSKKNSETPHNIRSTQYSGSRPASLLDFGQVGTEQPRKAESPRKGRDNIASGSLGNAVGNGKRSDGLGGVLRYGDGRHEPVGNLQTNGHQHRAVKPAQSLLDIKADKTAQPAQEEPLVDQDSSVQDAGNAFASITASNYVITPDDELGKGGAKAKFRDNINAITLLKRLRQQGADYATNEEQSILAKYVGWGGLAQAFDEHNAAWESEYAELKNLLAEDDYKHARRSTQDAHFTSVAVIQGMYAGLERLGVNSLETEKPLKILEPAAGIGNFIGLKPENLNADFYSVEQDILSADILRYLYPQEKHINDGFQNVAYSTSLFDLAIGNPPFGNQKLFDKKFPQLANFSIHNYFIAKSIDLVAEGGIGSFVVSRYFMDAHNSSHREYIADKAHFLGAVRLPSTAFEENALTSVTTDIVFFQKKTELERQKGIDKGHDWLKTGTQNFKDKKTEVLKEGSINGYFIQHPEQILGEMQFNRGQFEDELTCIADKDLDLAQAIQKAVKVLPSKVFEKALQSRAENRTTSDLEKKIIQSEYFQALKDGAFVAVSANKIGYKTKDDFLNFEIKEFSLKETEVKRVRGMIDVRDSLRTLINLEKTNAAAELIESQRKQLNIKYDSFVKKYGYLNSQTNRALFKLDPESALLQSLEVSYDKGVSKEQAKKTGREYRPPKAIKATIFTQRVLQYAEPAQSADSPVDALAISLRESGKIDFQRMAGLLGTGEDEVKTSLQNDALIFKNPHSGEWEIKDRYLTGNVKAKLHIAQKASADDPAYQLNVAALEEVQPKDIEAVDIGVRFGSTWIPPQVISDFLDEKIGNVSRMGRQIDYIPLLGRWDVNVSVNDYTTNYETWGTPSYPAEDLIKAILTNRPIKVEVEIGRDEHNKPIKEIDQEATAVALQKAEEIQRAFSEWIWEKDARREQLVRLYNDKFNTHVTPNYDGSHIELIGANAHVQLRPHQKNAVWRSIQEGTALFDHVVGAGKTMAAIATISESKRMGTVKKPMVVVPNHLVYQWRDEFFKLYPDANILVAEKTDFLKENRERFFSRVATGNWDAVIVAHSSFKKIDMPQQVQEEILQEQIEAVTQAISSCEDNKGSKFTVKQLEKNKERLQERFKKLLEQNNDKDKAVDFSDLGVDALFIDEAHEFKNLSFATTMNVSGLGNVAGSAKALDLFVKCRYLQKQHKGKGVYFLTGTPISNTIAEVYTMQRYMQFDELKTKDIEYFDAWASTFGKISTSWELDATGVNYKLKERFANFENVPELLAMYRTFADVVTKDDIDQKLKQDNKRSLTPPVKGGKPVNVVVERSPEQSAYMEEIIHRMENLPRDPRQDNPLKITNDARKAGLDYRLIDPFAPDFPDSKINQCADKIYEIWKSSAEDRGTQLVFCDLSTPKNISQEANPDPVKLADESQETEPDEKEQGIDMDEVLAGLASKDFSVYDDLRQKLVEKGIPRQEISFIHEANTDLRKSKLFSDVNKGNVRVLIGSTSKMGAGMNVQERLVAAHHLDAPWRPSDLEQRNGRIIRQGNSLYEKKPDFQVEIFNYATKQTYDARMWQTIEYKAAAIEQFRKGDVLQRSIDDIQSEASNAAEMKAAASGNPFILMEVNLNTEKRKLEALYAQHTRSKHRLADRVKFLEKTEARWQDIQKNYAENSALRDKNTHYVVEKGVKKIKVEVISEGKRLTADNAEALKGLFINGAKEVMRNRNTLVDFGQYRGFDVKIRSCPSNGKDGFAFILENNAGQRYTPKNLVYSYDDKVSLTGLFQRMDNFLDKGFEEKLTLDKQVHEKEVLELPNARKELSKPFDYADELEMVRENHAAVLQELKKMQADNQYISDWTPKTLQAFRLEKTALHSPLPEQQAKPEIRLPKSVGLAL